MSDNYSSTAVDTTLSGNIDGSATSLTVGSASGYPAAPFKITLAPDTGSEELVRVGVKVGAVFSSLTRGVDGTSAVPHSAGDQVRHQVAAEDIRLSRQHEDASADVHGLTGGDLVVGRTKVQTLEGKTITGGSNTISGITPAMMTLGTNWAAALAAALDTDTATVLGALHFDWPVILAAAPGANWATALAANLDSDTQAVLLAGGMATNWPAVLAASLGSDWATALAASYSPLPSVQAFTASGTWTKPANARTVLVEEVAGGGSGGGTAATTSGASAQGGGGGGGEYARGLFAASALGSTETVTVGGGGAAGAAGAAGNTGGTSSFGTHLTAIGGSGGGAGASAATSFLALRGLGGTGGTGGDLHINGGLGDAGLIINGADSAPVPSRGNGGGSVLGPGGIALNSTLTTAGTAGRLYGGGGSGASRFNTGAAGAASAGADGIVIVTTYF